MVTIATSPRFVPAIAIATEEDCCPVGMVKNIILTEHFSRGAKECPPSTVVAHYVVSEDDLGCPSEVFQSVAFTFFKGRKGFVQLYFKLFCSEISGSVYCFYSCDFVACVYNVHCFGVYRLPLPT